MIFFKDNAYIFYKNSYLKNKNVSEYQVKNSE